MGATLPEGAEVLRRRRGFGPLWSELSPLLVVEGPPPEVAFDADGTLWRGDVGEDFLRFLAIEGELPHAPTGQGVYGEYERRVAVDPADAYAYAVEVMAGVALERLVQLCRKYFDLRYAGRVFPFVRPALAALQHRGCSPWVVSASPRWIVQAGAAALGLDPDRVIGVSCPVREGRLTGVVDLPVPCGEGKVARLRERGVRPDLAVGNGELDLPMLAYAKRAVVVAPHGDPGNGLVRAALSRGWPVQRG